MPELAEVEFYRRKWDCGVGQKINVVQLHARKRVFRDTNTRELRRRLTGSQLLDSYARGKQMVFVFSDSSLLGIHLGMSGTLRVAPRGFQPGKHDHLALQQRAQALVYRD